MELYGYRLPDTSAYCIKAELKSLNPKIESLPTYFLIDTGCSITTLSFNDFKRTNMDFENLSESITISTANGNIDVRKITGVAIFFHGGNFSLCERLNEVHVKSYIDNSENDISLIGLDILSRYQIKYEKDYVVLIR